MPESRRSCTDPLSPRRRPKNVAASVRARLFELARSRGVELQLVLSEFAIERLLFRLGISSHADRFVLKGASLLKLWSDEQWCATWDLDLHGRGSSTIPDVVSLVDDLCAIPDEDGIELEPASICGEEIRVRDEYAGVRVRMELRQ